MLLILSSLLLGTVVATDYGSASACAKATQYGSGPPSTCTAPTDPNNKAASGIESWLTKEVFNDLFPKANIGWGPSECWPYSYEAFVIAARYFPTFGTSSPNTVYTEEQNHKRDVAAFFAHTIQETGENNIYLYSETNDTQTADNCFYRGGLYNWYEGGPTSAFIEDSYTPSGGDTCISAGRYCLSTELTSYFYPCNNDTTSGSYPYKGCYFGRGAIQISYNYNYGQFQDWLTSQNITVDILTNPNLVMTSMNPPLAVMASLWFYMTPQPPKPAMHDIILGDWVAGTKNTAAGYYGPIFGPTSLIINNECDGESATAPGGAGENRRIRAFKWFTGYFDVPWGNQTTVSCKDMPQNFDEMTINVSWEPDWSTTWQDVPCSCSPASYGGMINYYEEGYFPASYVALNAENEAKCIKSLYASPSMYSMDVSTSPCLNYPSNATSAKK